MKKLTMLFAYVILFSLSIHAQYPDKPAFIALETPDEKLNYALGLTNGKIIKDYHLKNDSTGDGIRSIIRGVYNGMDKVQNEVDSVKDKVISLAEMIGENLRKNDDFFGSNLITLDYSILRQGFVHGISGYEMGFSEKQASEFFNNTLQKIQNEKLMLEHNDNRLACIDFLKQNSLKEGVVTTESGLQYEIISQAKEIMPFGSISKSNRRKPTERDRVVVHYEGSLIDGTVFDSSYDRDQTAEFTLNQVIRGWVEGLQLMTKGSKFKFYIPENLAYGAQHQGTIKPYSALIFTVELIDIVFAKDSDPASGVVEEVSNDITEIKEENESEIKADNVVIPVLTDYMMKTIQKLQPHLIPVKSLNDSVNYTLGYWQGSVFNKEYFDNQEKADLLKLFVYELDKAFNNPENPDELYKLGVQVGEYLHSNLKGEKFRSIKVDYAIVLRGLINSLFDDESSMTYLEAEAIIEKSLTD